MKFTVVWVASAENEATRYWTERANRNEIGEAIDLIDTTLQRQPFVGESRGQMTDRVWLVDPVGVSFEVHEDDCKVVVTGLWLTRE